LERFIDFDTAVVQADRANRHGESSSRHAAVPKKDRRDTWQSVAVLPFDGAKNPLGSAVNLKDRAFRHRKRNDY
jgi:hypothetical protein